jgi:cytochrome b561
MILLAITISGYLIVTAKGSPLNVLNLFNIPASVSNMMNQADKAGEIHLLLAWALIILVSIHALAALNHHFIDKDRALNRMLGE